jgi:predicted Fe-S protein YdhL (DUF1289 family)
MAAQPIDSLMAGNWLTSPCVGICQLDHATGWCGGCGRSAAEMAAWSDLQAVDQHAVWTDLPRRKAMLGLGYQLLPWTGQFLLERLAERSCSEAAVWQIGVPGAGASFSGSDTGLAASILDGVLVLATTGARAVIRPTAGTRAFRMAGRTSQPERIVLALHRVRFKLPPSAVVTCLGPDQDALDPARRRAELFDLGLARRSMLWCVRPHARTLVELLRENVGTEIMRSPDLLQAITRSPGDFVVTSLLGRIEIDGSAAANELIGPNVVLEPALLASGRELEPGLHLPPDYVPCAQLVHPQAEH